MMQNGLEKFIKVNRAAFDTDEPSDNVWKNIEKTIVKKEEKKVVQFRSTILRISSIAAIVFLACLATWYFTNKNNTVAPVVAKTNVTTPAQPANKTAEPIPQQAGSDAVAMQAPKEGSNDETTASDYNQEIYYYTKLSEVKSSELRKMAKDQPALYNSFAGEIKKLDSAYRGLQVMLKGNADKEMILNAMLANLKMQTEILSKQLYIIRSIKQSKKGGDENNIKSI